VWVAFHATREHAFGANRRHCAEEGIWIYEEEVTGGWKKFCIEELHNFYPATKGCDFKEKVGLYGTCDMHVRYQKHPNIFSQKN
jgi:hypothetical protein